MPIRILPHEVASQIAAGEVVERPASVVKELLENALDAGAQHITIRVESAGKRFIEVADDGAGIPADEMTLALQRHATSKLLSAADLFHIGTLGFRGEALASIASVSRLTLVSRPGSAELGAKLVVEGGRGAEIEPTGAPPGTLVRVEDLFYNVPARLKFLKHDATERQQIDALVTRYALAYPQVRLSLTHDGKPSLQTSGKGDPREVLAALYGIDTARQMLAVVLEEDEISVHGFSSPLALTRSNRREITFFVNGRWVQDGSLSASLLRAYHTLLMVGRYPLCFLMLNIPPEAVDVNVHPAKAEVRFRQSDLVFSFLQRAVRRALLAHSPVPPTSLAPWQFQGAKRLPIQTRDEFPPTRQPALSPLAPGMQAAPERPPTAGATTDDLPTGQIPILRLVGQLTSTYLVAEGPDGLYLVDQHAAHERVLYERYLKYLAGSPASQALLIPAMLHLPPAPAHLLQEQLPILATLGFVVEEFGSGSFRLRAIPAFLSQGDPLDALRAVVEEFEEDESPLQAQHEARLAARICKRMAVKAGQNLTPEEQRALLQDLERCPSPRTCPHGRPTMIHLPVDLLERQFGRRGSR
jgi:DNA mismatch repair protein MutL